MRTIQISLVYDQNEKKYINLFNNKNHNMSIGIQTNKEPAIIVDLPNECPFCHSSISPNIHFGFISESYKMDVFFSCPKNTCLKTFIGEYEETHNINCFEFQNRVTKGSIVEKDFNQSIMKLSLEFVTIYNQAFYAEQEGLFEICGVGYRKALEYLIKDYAKFKYPNEAEQIEQKLLAKCIKDYIDDKRIESVSKRAVWLGNDETHYVRRWENKDLSDLKKLIDLTLHWIEMEFLTVDFENEMPE